MNYGKWLSGHWSIACSVLCVATIGSMDPTSAAHPQIQKHTRGAAMPRAPWTTSAFWCSCVTCLQHVCLCLASTTGLDPAFALTPIHPPTTCACCLFLLLILLLITCALCSRRVRAPSVQRVCKRAPSRGVVNAGAVLSDQVYTQPAGPCLFWSCLGRSVHCGRGDNLNQPQLGGPPSNIRKCTMAR